MKRTCASALALAFIAGGVVPQAMAQHQLPQTVGMARKIEPLRVAKVRKTATGMELVGAWSNYVRPVGADIQMTPAFDLFEADSFDPVAGGNPVGFCSGGCTQANNCPGAPESSRWWNGATYVLPIAINDMTVATGMANAQSTRALIAWNWGPTAPTQCFVAIFTAETMNACGGTEPASGYYDGIILDFGPQAGGAGYFTSDVDLSADPTLFWQLPADGSGAYEYDLGNAFDGTTFTLDTTPGTQIMLWGAGEDEVTPDGRVGSQTPQQYDDDVTPYGQIDTTLECYAYGPYANFCPDVLGAMILFFGEGGNPGGCYANCDNSTQQPVLNVADFTCFLQRYAAGDTYANCDNSTQQPVLNVADFTCFLQSYAAGCP